MDCSILELTTNINKLTLTPEKEHFEYKFKKLEDILIKNKMNYKNEIIKEKTLKDAHIYCKINFLSGQLSGPLIEYYIITQNNMKKNNASDCNGDVLYDNNNIEIKISLGGKNNNKFNYVQLRMNHECSYILTAYYIDETNIKNLGELFIFKLIKEELIDLIKKYGNYAHGTKKKLGEITIDNLKDITNNKEYSIRPKVGDDCWKTLLQFRINEISI